MTDIVVICAYLVLLPAISIVLARRGEDARNGRGEDARNGRGEDARNGRGADARGVHGEGAMDFLGAAHSLPPWAICLSLVATETSTLTFISVPGIGYVSGMVFAGLAGGYLLGRCIVAIWFLPLYARGEMRSAYQYLGERFGPGVQRVASLAFLLTRLFAEGVRLMAGMLPLAFMLGQAGLPLHRMAILGLIMAATLLYTMLGGLRAVVWSDAIQLALYLSGAVLCVWWLGPVLAHGGLGRALASGHLALFHGVPDASALLADPFTLPASLIGGAILSIASHGTDQLMVQRLLAASTLSGARGALVGSAVVVGVLFALLSMVGVQLWLAHGGRSLAQIGLHGPDDVFPRFIATGLPQGLSGLLVAGTLSATMGSLSSTLNAMAGVVLSDFGPGPGLFLRRCARLGRAAHAGRDADGRGAARLATLFWAVALALCALSFAPTGRSAVILGLTVAGWSYGPTLGIFVFGMAVRGAGARDAMAGLLLGLIGMAAFMGVAQQTGLRVAFVWLVPIGAIATMATAACSLALRSTMTEKHS